MSATEELRALLDGRGVEYQTADGWWTSWDAEGVVNGESGVYAEDLGNGLEIRWYTITPEQAVEATLGRGTCRLRPWRMEPDTGYYDCMECDCGLVQDVADWADTNYCPKCGGRIEVVE